MTATWLQVVARSGHDLCRDWLFRHAHQWRGVRRPLSARVPARKVLHVTTSFDLGGTQMQIKHLATTPAARFQHDAIELFPELNYLFRQSARVDPERYIRGGPLARMIGRWIVDRNRRGFHLIQIAKLVRDFRVERPDVVIGWGHEICAITFVAAAVAAVPHIVFCIRTANPAYGWTEPSFGALLLTAHQRMTARVDRIVVNSTFLQQDYSVWVGMEPRAVDVCPNGIALVTLPTAAAAAARSRIRAMFGIPDTAVVITNVGRFSKEKGQLSLLEANRLLLASLIDAQIVWLLCGDGPTLPEVQAAAASQGMTNVVCAGRTDAIRDILAASDVFVMPSDFEGMPNAMMEAMAAGLACVSTTRSGAVDVARDGIEALYYDPRDVQQLAKHLATLIDNPARARELGAAAAERIKRFDVPTFVNNFEAILDGVLHSSVSVPSS